MNCREAEEWIPDYLEEEMELPVMKQFLPHIRSCDKCLDELETQFLVKEGLQRLEDGEAFDLRRELNSMLERSERTVRIAETVKYTMILGAVVLVIAIILVVFSMLR